MIKTIPLFIAALKGFFRNWKSVILLIVVPLVLIITIFISFNPLGMQRTPVGLILKTDAVNMDELNPYVESYLEIDEFATVDDCIIDAKKYNQYVCLEVVKNGSIILNIHFDNTRTPIIWEVLATIKGSIDYLQKQKSREFTNKFLDEVRSSMIKAHEFESGLQTVDEELTVYIGKLDNLIVQLTNTKQTLVNELNTMDNNIDNLESESNSLGRETSFLQSQSQNNINYIENSVSGLPADPIILQRINNEIDDLEYLINSYDQKANSLLYQIDNNILNYERGSSRLKNLIFDIDDFIYRITTVKNNLNSYQSDIRDIEDELISIIEDMNYALETADPEVLINPIIMKNYPIYIPDVDIDLIDKFGERFEDMSDIEKAIRGLSLINLQTVFPMILLLITLYLSLLVASFICLNEINSSANTRVSLIRRIFFHDFLAVYLSSLVIILVPVLIVALLGNFLFLLNIVENFGLVLLILVLVMSAFILFGIGLAYLIKKESITLLISTFFLVFLLFFSGFMLPIERMTKFSATLANIFPGKLAFTAFNKVVFHNQGFSTITQEIGSLLIWCFALLAIVLVIKRIRQN